MVLPGSAKRLTKTALIRPLALTAIAIVFALAFTGQAFAANGNGSIALQAADVSADSKLKVASASNAPSAPVQTRASITQTKAQRDIGAFTVTVSDVSRPESVKAVTVAIWSKAQGQDDITWVKATRQKDGSWKARSNCVKGRRAAGIYIAHAYATRSGSKKSCIAKATSRVRLAPAQVRAVVDAKQKTVALTAKGGAFARASAVRLPLWSKKGGQDDLIWYKAKKKGGIWKAKAKVGNHKTAGTYLVHGYATIGKRQSMAARTKFSIAAPKAQVSVVGKANGTYTVAVSDILCPSGIASVTVPSWTKAKGKDDLYRHKAKRQSNGSWKASIAAKHHGGQEGLYLSRAYVVGTNGVKAAVGTIRASVKAKDYVYLTGTAHSGARTVWVKNPSTSKLKATSWSLKGGKDDLQRSRFKRNEGNLWSADIDCRKLRHSGSVIVKVTAGGKELARKTFTATKRDLTLSGDRKLDRIINHIIKTKTGRGPGALSKAFNYVSFSFRYISGSTYPTGNWSVPFAKEFYRNGGGNCYRFAALFCWIAKGLGYDAKVVAGHVPSASSGWAPHGWVEIRSNGRTYVCDPDMANAIPNYNWYWITYGQAPIAYRK